MTDQDRDELLIELKTDVKHLCKDFENHLSHHFRYTFYAWTLATGSIVTLVLYILKVL